MRLSIPSCLPSLLLLSSHVYILLLSDSFCMKKKEERTRGVPNPRFLSSLPNYFKEKSITIMFIKSKRTLACVVYQKLWLMRVDNMLDLNQEI